MQALVLLVSIIIGTAVFGIVVTLAATLGGAAVGASELVATAAVVVPLGYLAGRTVHRRMRSRAQ